MQESDGKDSLTWLAENVEQAAALGVCTYYGRLPDGSCEGCPADADTGPCDKSVLEDVARRLRGLIDSGLG